jgi:RNA polymerase sigma-B factor
MGRGRRGRTVWVSGAVSDAVAVSLAYRQSARARGGRLRAFSTDWGEGSGSVSFSMADIRSLPVRVRREGFRPGPDGWVPVAAIAEEVVLGPPPGPVDMVVARGRSLDRATLRRGLRPGGLLLVMGPAPEGLVDHNLFEPVEKGPLLRRLTGPGGCDRRAGGTDLADPSETPDARTLAQKLVEDELVSRHLNLARSLARRFSGHGEPVEDLRQVAFVGLVLAARRYDPDQNASFSTYATATILGELKRYFRDKSWMMRVPRQVQETYLAIKAAREELFQELSASPTIPQLAARLRISEEAVLEAMEAGDNFLPQSLDASPDEDGAGREVPIIDPAFDATLERNLLSQALPRLTKREQLVLKRVYLDGCTQRQVAAEIGVSQMQVSRLLHASGQKVRSWTGD